MEDEVRVAATRTGVAQVFDLHALKAFAPDTRVRKMIFYVRRDPALRARWLTDLPGIAKEFGLSRVEYEAIRDQDPKRLMDLGVHQYYVPQILRLFFGAAQNENASAALQCYRRAFPEETATALALETRREGTYA